MHGADDPQANGRSDEVVDAAGVRDGAHRMRHGAAGGGESVLDGVAGGGCGALVLFEPRGAGASDRPQDEERGDGQSDAARDREQSRHAGLRCVHHLMEPEADAKTGDAARGRRERHDGEVAGLAQVGPSGTTHWEALAFAGSVIGPRVYRVGVTEVWGPSTSWTLRSSRSARCGSPPAS